MKVAIINKSDSTGGAAIVSFRLAEALRNGGTDARMLVVEKLSDARFVDLAASKRRIQIPFLAERLGIFLRNGLSRDTLFKIDTASAGLPLHRHPDVKSADVVCLNWINQGMLSLREIGKIMEMGKPVVWTMHDMWNFTGVCHHAGECPGYLSRCADCPLLARKWAVKSLAMSTWERKHKLYSGAGKIHFVAVSNWLAHRARKSSLIGGKLPLSVIPNAFPFPARPRERRVKGNGDPIRILFGAARLDDPVKDLPALIETTRILRSKYPQLAERVELVTFGGVKNRESLEDFFVPARHLGMIHGSDAIRKVYEEADILVSTSRYETLPGTLVEAQAYGCVPVSTSRGGQSDIIDHLSTGYLGSTPATIADGIAWASAQISGPDADPGIFGRMLREARFRFSAEAVAARYLSLFRSLLKEKD